MDCKWCIKLYSDEFDEVLHILNLGLYTLNDCLITTFEGLKR